MKIVLLLYTAYTIGVESFSVQYGEEKQPFISLLSRYKWQCYVMTVLDYENITSMEVLCYDGVTLLYLDLRQYDWSGSLML